MDGFSKFKRHMLRNDKNLLRENFFPSSLQSNLNICRLNFENLSISSQDMSKKPFPIQTGSRFLATTFFHHHLDKTWTYAVWISKIRLLVLMLWAKSLFPSQPEVDFQRRQFFVITSIDPKHMPFEFWESVHKYSGYEPKTCFWRSFSIFLAKPEVDFKNERWWTLFPDEPEFMPFKFWKSVH